MPKRTLSAEEALKRANAGYEQLTRQELQEALHARQTERKSHATRARSALVDGKYSDAISAFTAAILLTVASSHGDAIQLAASDRWKASDPRRNEVAELYSGRALAAIRLERWADALKDAHAANFLAPHTHASLGLLAAAAAGWAKLPQEPVAFFTDDPMPGASAAEAREFAVSMTQQLAHGLVADVFSMLSEAEDVKPGSPQQREALDSRDYHAALSHGGLHPLGDRSVTSRLPSAEAYSTMTMAIESLTIEPIDPRANTPKVAMLAQMLISLTAFRLGCRVPPLECRPRDLVHTFHEDRVIEQWLRSRVERMEDAAEDDVNEEESEEEPKPGGTGVSRGAAAPGKASAERDRKKSSRPHKQHHQRLKLGQEVRLVGLQTRPNLNGRSGSIVSYDKIKDRYKVVLSSLASDGASEDGSSSESSDGQPLQARLWLKARNLEDADQSSGDLKGDDPQPNRVEIQAQGQQVPGLSL